MLPCAAREKTNNKQLFSSAAAHDGEMSADDELSVGDLLLRTTEEEDRVAAAATARKKRSTKAPSSSSTYMSAKRQNIVYESDAYGINDDALTPSSFNFNALHTVGASLGHAVRASWRGLVYGEKMVCADDEQDDAAPAAAVVAIGDSDGSELSQYISKWKGKNRFQAITGWYVRVAHHDPLGSDPWMMTTFLIAFAATMFYDTFVEALFLTLVLAFAEWILWMVVRASMPIVSRELDAAESGIITLVYNIFSIGAGLGVGTYVRHTWPGLLSIWKGLENKACGSDGVSFVWAPCMDTQTFFAVALLFTFIILSSFAYFYVASWVLLLLLVPFAAFTAIEFDVFNTLLLTTVSVAFFLAWMVAPIKRTYVWNMFFAISLYLFIYSIAALSAF